MPLFEFECVVCRKVVEKFQPKSDPEAPPCCGQAMHLLVSAPTILSPDYRSVEATAKLRDKLGGDAKASQYVSNFEGKT